jgi:uncharacterized coiled-coil protein SlyX
MTDQETMEMLRRDLASQDAEIEELKDELWAKGCQIDRLEQDMPYATACVDRLNQRLVIRHTANREIIIAEIPLTSDQFTELTTLLP